MGRVGLEERQRIVDLLHEHGGNRHKVAVMCERSKQTVSRIARDEGIESDVTQLKKAEAQRDPRRFLGD